MRISCATNVITEEFGGCGALPKMRVGPLEVGLQEQASNRHKLLRLRAWVVSVAGKGGARLHQVGTKETNASELLMTCRNVFRWRRKQGQDVCPARKVEGCLFIAQPASGMKAA